MSKLVVSATSGKTVNLRQQPSTNATVIQSIPITSEVELIEKTSDNWYKVKYQGKEGYMMAIYLKEKNVSKDDLRKIYNSLHDTLVLIEKVLK